MQMMISTELVIAVLDSQQHYWALLVVLNLFLAAKRARTTARYLSDKAVSAR
jgi:hypothetical protein